MDMLVAWIGNSDLSAAERDDPEDLGPIAQALKEHRYSRAVFLENYRNERVRNFLVWIKDRFQGEIYLRSAKLSSPTCHKEIYAFTRNVVNEVEEKYPDASLTFHLSPGTPAMALVWMLLAPRYGAKLIESSRQGGVLPVTAPFEIAAYFLPDREIESLSRASAPEHPAFGDILHKGESMKLAINQASRMAPRDITIFIEGESGTGKELFARAIHKASKRAKGPFVAVNCGAIPSELVESQLFGHVKGAFTNAIANSAGYFGQGHGGTLFLDEIGELPPQAQVKLLRALEENAIVPVGTYKEQKIDVRVIAATNRNLMQEVANGNFRSDLLYRLAVGIIRLPALRERGSDLELLLEEALANANRVLGEYGDTRHKKFSDAARKIMLDYSWPGNVRELKNTIIRAALWAEGDIIDAETAKNSLLSLDDQGFLLTDHPLGNGFKIDDFLESVERRYLKKAIQESNGVLVKAARLLGLNNYQTLANRLKKYGID